MNLTILQDASSSDEPLQVSDVGTYLVVDSSSATADLQSMIAAARLVAETENGRELARKQYKLVLDRFPTNTHFPGVFGFAIVGPYYGERQYNSDSGDGMIELLDPLVSVDLFTYRKSDGTVVTLAENTDYLIDVNKHPGIVCPAYGKQWPTDTLWPTSAIEITFTAGMTPVQVPGKIKVGMGVLISEWYENRLPFSGAPSAAEVPCWFLTAFQSDKLWKF
jgi:hypothetical protein